MEAIRTKTVRIRFGSDVQEIVKKLSDGAMGVPLSETQIVNLVLVRGARALLADLEMGGELPGIGGDPNVERN